MGRKMKIDEVCERLGVSRPALAQLYYRGDGPPRIALSPRRFLWDEESLEAWLMARERTAREAVHA